MRIKFSPAYYILIIAFATVSLFMLSGCSKNTDSPENVYNNLLKNDPEFMERHEAFALSEVVNEQGLTLDDETRYLAILAVLIGNQSIDQYKLILSKALDGAINPVMAKEVVYQAVAYLGSGPVYPFLTATNEVMADKGIKLPLEGQATTTMENRREKGTEAQMAIFGPRMENFWKGGHMNRWLAANCFGDYYTRNGLSLKQRELMTFCFLAAQGGSEPQLKSHVFANINLGNDREMLIKVVSQSVPYIGYPRSLNAIAAINEITAPKK